MKLERNANLIIKALRVIRRVIDDGGVVFANGIFLIWAVWTSKFARVRSVVSCDVWVVGVLGSPRDDVSRKFPKFVFGSFFQSFGVSPSGEFPCH